MNNSFTVQFDDSDKYHVLHESEPREISNYDDEDTEDDDS